MDSSELSRILDTLAESVCSDSDVEFVVAFGSRIAGGPTQASDIDLAIKFADDLTDRERFDKRCFLSGDLQLEEAPFVDVSDIETLPLDVAHDAVNGQFVCGDEQAFAQFEMTIEATFAEQRETLFRDEFLQSTTEQRAVERMFENAIQACSDLAQHIATQEFDFDGETAKGAIRILQGGLSMRRRCRPSSLQSASETSSHRIRTD